MKRARGRRMFAVRAVAYMLAAVTAISAAACGNGEDAEPSALRVRVDSLLPRVERLSGLEAREEVNVATRSRDELRSYIAEQLAGELPEEEMAGLEASYKAFGLLPDTLDLRALLLELYSEQVSGYYDPESKTLFLIEGVPPEAAEPVLAHELVHALQDQHINLDSLIAPARGNDRQTAAQAVVEGHATLVMFALVLAERTGSSVDIAALPDLGRQLRPAIESQNARLPVFSSAPRLIREILLFPYLSGAGFVQSVWRERSTGGPQGNGGALERPAFTSMIASSTEQVMHPAEKYLATPDPPTDVVLAAVQSVQDAEGDVDADGNRSGWRIAYENTLGELETGILLTEHLGTGADSAARGWDGDRFQLLRDGAGGTVLAWVSVWDDPAAADAFTAAYRRVLEARPNRHGRVDRMAIGGRPVVRVLDAERAIEVSAVPWPEIETLEEGV